MKTTRILITGSSGQLGSELKAIWKSDSRFELLFLDRQDLDLSMTTLIQRKLENVHPDIIIHSGAYTSVDLAETEIELADKVNHLATLEIAKYSRSNSVKLIYISTDYVFQGNVDKALDENCPTDPINVYGATKRKGELAVLEYCQDAIIIRTAWVYSTFGKNFVKTMLYLMSSREEINVVSDQIGSPTYARDLAGLIKEIITEGKWVPGIYHYSNEGRISWFDFAVAIRDISKLECKINPIPTSSFPTTARRPSYSLLNKNKVKNTFGAHVSNWRDSLEIMLGKLSRN
ncbi:dTDP-4-dehydrorhamnose reductase [Sphingobacterium cellulitidis]|uniref:dTDP-4-dehydrorhamnose reductase n=1 Tax=Sphingobacterium cellulitidis TaxID=1768011 RepID=UPI00370DB724